MAKHSITIEIDSEIKNILEKRAKKEMLSLRELISEILRRSVISYKKNSSSVSDKLDDQFIGYFSRKTKKRKKK